MTSRLTERFHAKVTNEPDLPEYPLNNVAVHLSTP